MTARELIEHLSKLPPETRIVVSGYEGGYQDARIPKIEDLYVLRENVYTEWYYGTHELAAVEYKSPNGEYAVLI